MPQLRFAQKAEDDVAEIGRYIAKSSPANAARFVARLQRLCRVLADHPFLGRARDDLIRGVRSIPFGRYVIFYRPLSLADGVEIIRIIHGARDIQRELAAR